VSRGTYSTLSTGAPFNLFALLVVDFVVKRSSLLFLCYLCIYAAFLTVPCLQYLGLWFHVLTAITCSKFIVNFSGVTRVLGAREQKQL